MSAQQNLGVPILSRLNSLALYVAGAGLILMTVVVAWQVFCRYVLNDSPAWTDVSAVLIMSWFIFLGAAVGVRENNHMGFDVLLYVLPPSAKKWLRMISDVVIFAFAIGMVWFGVKQAANNWGGVMPTLHFPEGVRFIPLAAGGVLIALFSLERILLRLRGAPIDDALDEMSVPEIAVELESMADIQNDAAQIARPNAPVARKD